MIRGDETNFFVDGFEDLHNDVEQMIRQEKSRDVTLTDFGGVKQRARVVDKGYEVTLENCTCRDFQIR